MTPEQEEAIVRGFENDFEADMAARYEGAGDPGPAPEPEWCDGYHGADAADRYDELMRKDPLTRTDEEEAFVEHLGDILSAEVMP